MTAGRTCRPADVHRDRERLRPERRPDPLQPDVLQQVHHRRDRLLLGRVQPVGNTFTVTAPPATGVWKVYVYAYDGHGNVGIETRSFNVVAPPVGGTKLSAGKPATASTEQAR